MPLSYIDDPYDGKAGYFVVHNISGLVSSFLEPKNPSAAFRRSFRLAELLLLSNRIEDAYSLVYALYKHLEMIPPPEKGQALQASYSTVLDYFWYTHPAYPLPEKSPFKSRQPNSVETAKAGFEARQWREYRECTRTGWMLEHCKLAEPDDPHIWQETHDGPMIAMCARLLAKDKTPNQYPPLEQLREALAAAKKLYAQPQVPITEWSFKQENGLTVRRHSYLLYRRLVVELAIRVGELDTAADVLSKALRLDGFNSIDGGQLNRFLNLPGIYDVLPLLAEKGKEGNPYFIEKDDAGAMVHEIIRTLELRSEHGWQWSLAPEKVGWRALLDRLANAAWEVNSEEYKESGIKCAADILHKPASEEDIKAVEDRVGELPEDFKQMLRTADGFKGGWHFLSGGLSGCKGIQLDNDGYWENFFDYDVPNLNSDDYSAKSITLEPGTECDGFHHFIIPPTLWRKIKGKEAKDGEYRYCHWASWQGSNSEWESVRDWVAGCVEALEEEACEKNKV